MAAALAVAWAVAAKTSDLVTGCAHLEVVVNTTLPPVTSADGAQRRSQLMAVNHLVVVVECTGAGDCCEAANKFMRQVRGSDGYGVYSNIIGRKVAVLGLGKMGKTTGACKVEENLLKRGGCKKLVPKVGRADMEPSGDLATLPWVVEVREALEATMDHPPPTTECCAPGAASKQQGGVVASPPAAAAAPAADVGSPPHVPPPVPPSKEDVLESEQTIGEGILVGIVVLVAALALVRYARS